MVQAGETVPIQIDEREVATSVPESEGKGPADPVRGARHHRDLSLQIADALAPSSRRILHELKRRGIRSPSREEYLKKS